jgi:L-lactate permease
MKKKNNKRNWLERKLDEHNHTMSLIRTVLPFVILVIQIYIINKIN